VRVALVFTQSRLQMRCKIWEFLSLTSPSADSDKRSTQLRPRPRSTGSLGGSKLSGIRRRSEGRRSILPRRSRDISGISAKTWHFSAKTWHWSLYPIVRLRSPDSVVSLRSDIQPFNEMSTVSSCHWIEERRTTPSVKPYALVIQQCVTWWNNRSLDCVFVCLICREPKQP
jgi:hypothetical protein